MLAAALPERVELILHRTQVREVMSLSNIAAQHGPVGAYLSSALINMGAVGE